MKEFFNLMGWKNLLIVFFALIIIRISIVIPFYAQHMLPDSITWDYYLMYAFGIVFMLAGNNVATKFFSERYKVQKLSGNINLNIKDYPDLVRFRGVWLVLSFVGLVSVVWAGVMTDNLYFIILACLVLMLGYTYASVTRHKFLLGNLSLAVTHSAIIMSVLPDISKVSGFDNYIPAPGTVLYSDIIMMFCFIAAMVFILTLIWDITGDVTNIKDDYRDNFQTVATVLGEKKCKNLLYSLSALFISLTGIFTYIYYPGLGVIQSVTVLLIVAIPMIYYIFELRRASVAEEYDFLYTFLGMIFISILFLIYFCKYIFINGRI